MTTEFTAETIKLHRRQRRQSTREAVEATRRLTRSNAAFLRRVVYSEPVVDQPPPRPHPVVRAARVASQTMSRMVGRVFGALRGR